MRSRGSVSPFRPDPACPYPEKGTCRCERPRWRVRATVGDDPLTGSERRLSKVVEAPHNRRGLTAAETAVAQLISDAEQERRDQKAAPERMTLNEALDRWLDHNRDRWAGKTLKGYEDCATKIRPALGDRLVSSLTVSDLERFYKRLGKSGLGPATVRKVHVTMSGCLTLAVRWGALTASPAVSAKSPEVQTRDIEPPEPEHLAEQLVRLISEHPDVGAWILVAAGTGMRPQEQCALRWSDIDTWTETVTDDDGTKREVTLGTATVRRAIRLGKPGEPRWVIATTKTKRGRQVDFGHGVATALAALRTQHVEQLAAVDRQLDPHAYVFTLNALDGRHTDPELWSRRWGAERPLLKHERSPGKKWGEEKIALRDRYGMAGVRLYDLRHFAATQMIAEGHDVAAVALHLGHSPAVLMTTYAHGLDENRRAAADSLDAKLSTALYA